MSDSVQDVYAKNLPTEFGYPLRIPEPSSHLPELYQENGLQIGDVGYVDRYGGFHVLFNIRYSAKHELHRKHRPPSGFEPISFNEEKVDVHPNSICPDQFISSPHITNKAPQQSDERVLYRFVPSSPSGAILVLPFGAIRHELKETEMDNFRRIAVEHGQSWCSEAGRDSVYLITGFHKARSWSLGSFRNAPHGAEILVKKPNEEDEPGGIHRWDPTFSMYWRTGPGCENDNLNQTVFITGFKVTVRWWLCVPDVELLQRSSSAWLAFFRLSMIFLLYIIRTLWERIALQRHEHVPQLSPPFHPSDVINRYLLAKNPNANVAVTHDRQWMSVLKMEELIHDGVVNDGYVWEVLSDQYVSASDNDIVWLERKSGDANKPSSVASSLEVSALSSNENIFVAASGPENAICLKHEVPSLRMPSIDNPWIVISRIRVDNVIAGLNRLPVGFYIDLQFNGVRRRTKVRSIPVYESVIEWDDEFILSNDPSVGVQLSFCAAFEFEPMLGNGSTLCTADITVGDLVGNPFLINFSSGARERRSSLLIIAERQYCPYYQAYFRYENRNLNRETSSATAHETNIGRDALLRYHEYYREEDLKEAISHFECALRVCHPDDECRPTALFNLAMVKLHIFQLSGSDTAIAESVALYREALDMRRAPHPDRPATLLGLGHALLFRYRTQGQDKSLADDLEKFMNEVKKTCAEGSHEHRAAILVLQTYKRIRAELHCTLSEINDLIVELDAAVGFPPGNYYDRPCRLENLGLALKRRFKIRRDKGRLADLDQAIAKQEDAIQLLHEHSPDRGSHLDQLGVSLRTRFKKLGDIRDLEQAIARQEKAVQLTPENHPDRANVLQNLGASLRTRFDKLGDICDLEQAIARQEQSLQLTPENHPARAKVLKNLGSSLRARFNKLGDIRDLDQAIAKWEEVVQLTPENHPNRARHLKNLGSSRGARFDKLGDIRDLEQVIARREEVVQLTPGNHPDRAQRLSSLGSSLRARFNKLGDIRDLEQVIARQEEVVQLTPENHPDRAKVLQNLGSSLGARFSKLGDIRDLEQVIARQEEVVQLTPENHPDRAKVLQNLGASLRARFDKLGDIRDLEQVIARQEQSLQLTPENHPDRAKVLQNLGSSLGARFNKLGDIRDLEQVIAKWEEVVQLTPENHPDRANVLQNLGSSRGTRFDKLGDIRDLDQAIAGHNEAIHLTPENHPDRCDRLLCLGISLKARFDKLGDLRDLEQAIARQQEAVRLIPENHRHRAHRLCNLGISLLALFNELGDISDVEQAVALQQEAVRLTPENCPRRAHRLCNLGISLRNRFDKLGDISDLEQAVMLQQEAVRLPPENCPHRAHRLCNLGTSLRTRFDKLGDISDLEQAVMLQQEAVRLTPENCPRCAHRLHHLGISLRTRFDELGDISDLKQAIVLLEEVVRLTPENHPKRAGRLRILAASIGIRSNMSGHTKDMEGVISMEDNR